MEAFKVPNELMALLGSYPNASDLINAAKNGGETCRIAIARLWLSEGIPYAFKNNPALYESIRTWLSARLDVDPKDVHLTGSARLGQSLAPNKIGIAFGTHSDLDIFIVSSSLFMRMTDDFNLWSYQFEAEKIKPQNQREKLYWQDNIQRGPKNIQKGFIDSNLIPNGESFETIRSLSQSMYLLKRKLDITSGAPVVKGASIRCYRDWSSYVQQIVRSFA